MTPMPCIVTRDIIRHERELDAAESKARALEAAAEDFTVDVEPQEEGGWGYVLYRNGIVYDADPGPWDTDNQAMQAGKSVVQYVAQLQVACDCIAAAEPDAY